MLVVMRDHFPVLLDVWTAYLSSLTCRLFVNDVDPEEAHEAIDYQEATFGGYVAQASNTWSLPFLNQDGIGEMRHDPVVFTRAGPGLNEPVYGYYLTDQYGYLFAAERNDAGPVFMGTPGQTFVVVPIVTLQNYPVLAPP